MKRIFYLLAVMLVVFTGCKKEEEKEPTGDSFETLTTYMADNSMDLPDVLNGWITGAPAEADLAAFLDTYYIIDIRSADAYAAGHIQGAVNSSLASVVNEAQNATKPILVVCYTGQTASHAVVALRLSGYPDAKVLKFGMSGWNSSLSGPWAGNIGNEAANHSGSWQAAPGSVTATGSFDNPSFTTSSTNGADILEERVENMLTNGFKGLANTEVLANPGNYFINNFWATTDVEHYGHITGAYRIKPLTLDNINSLNPTETIVTYCWTGQTSSMVTAYLNVIGYNAMSLKFGTNGMIYDDLESHKFVAPTTDLPVVQ